MSISKAPLVVDLDGTLIATDTLVESVVKLIKRSPLNLFRLFFWLLRGRASLKSQVAALVELDASRLPYRQELLAYVKAERAAGRKIVLATAAHESIASKVASHLGLFDLVLATKGSRNLKGDEKLKAIRSEVGERFSYAGDSATDLPVWCAAESALLVGVSNTVAKSVRAKNTLIEREFAVDSGEFGTWLRALRVHQWVKNSLLFVPFFLAFGSVDPFELVWLVIAFFAFSFVASATYVVNDLWDLDNDRGHPRKCKRPFASGALSIPRGLAVSGALLVTGFGAALVVTPAFCLMLLVYLVVTSAYSWFLKGYVLMDVMSLSVLYTLRILAGALASTATISSWLLAFSVFMFLSLALVKRCGELVSLEAAGGEATTGRDYRVTDLAVLWPLGVGAALSAVVVFGLFISSPDTTDRYGAPELLWLAALGLIYWLARLWIKTSRGEMHDDPVAYAIKDRGSRITVLFMLGIVLLAHSLHIPL